MTLNGLLPAADELEEFSGRRQPEDPQGPRPPTQSEASQPPGQRQNAKGPRSPVPAPVLPVAPHKHAAPAPAASSARRRQDRGQEAGVFRQGPHPSQPDAGAEHGAE